MRQKSCGTRRLLVAAIIAALSMQNALVAAQEPDPVSREEKNKAVAMRVFEEIFNQKKLEVASEIYSPEFVKITAFVEMSRYRKTRPLRARK